MNRRFPAIEVRPTKGQVDDLSAAVQVTLDIPGGTSPGMEGRPMTLDATGFFTTPVDTLEGPMTFSATATDPAGNAGQATRSILVDWTAPIITLDAPVPVLISATAYTFNGRVDDPKAAFTVNGQTVALDADGRFSLTLPLVEGLNGFHMEATDLAGNLGSLDATILRDTVPPVIRLDAPAEGLLTNALQIQVQGQVDDLEAAVVVNGEPVTLDGVGRFSLTLSPLEGPLTILATAMDPAGNVGQDLRHVLIDRTPPKITLLRPVPVLTSNPKLDLQGLVDDPAAFLTLNGAPLALDALGGFTTSVMLTEGVNSFMFLAQDRAGNASTLNVSVVLDTKAPVLLLVAPVEGLRTNLLQISVVGSVTLDIPGGMPPGMDDAASLVKVNGQVATVDASGGFTVPLTPAEGPLTILVTAADTIGNQSDETRHIFVDRTPPRITLTRSVPALVSVTSMLLQGAVDDPTASLTFNGAAVTLDAQGGFVVEASLSEGGNAFHFVAIDTTGNVGVLDASTVRDTTPPVVTLDSPQDGLVTHQHSILVKGSVDDPTARLLVAGQSLSPLANGTFEVTLTPGEGPLLIVALATDPAGNTGHAVRSVTLDWTPPVLVWAAPTPPEGAKVSITPVAVAATVSESATVTLNGQAMALEASAPWVVKTSLSPAQGPVTLRLEATDRAGNSASSSLFYICYRIR